VGLVVEAWAPHMCAGETAMRPSCSA
jgi:hypothetical protein